MSLMVLFWNFPLICNFPLLFSHSKNIWMSTLITIITYYSLIIIIIIIGKSHNNYGSVGVMGLCLLNLLTLSGCFFCNTYPYVLFERLSHVIHQESHVYSWNLGEIYFVHFLKFWNLSKFQESELGKLIPHFPPKHLITSKYRLHEDSNSCFLYLFHDCLTTGKIILTVAPATSLTSFFYYISIYMYVYV